MGDRLIDDHTEINFFDDSIPPVFCFVDDAGNFTCDPPVLWAQSCMSILVALLGVSLLAGAAL
jgi:hypothetical protein